MSEKMDFWNEEQNRHIVSFEEDIREIESTIRTHHQHSPGEGIPMIGCSDVECFIDESKTFLTRIKERIQELQDATKVAEKKG